MDRWTHTVNDLAAMLVRDTASLRQWLEDCRVGNVVSVTCCSRDEARRMRARICMSARTRGIKVTTSVVDTTLTARLQSRGGRRRGHDGYNADASPSAAQLPDSRDARPPPGCRR